MSISISNIVSTGLYNNQILNTSEISQLFDITTESLAIVTLQIQKERQQTEKWQAYDLTYASIVAQVATYQHVVAIYSS